MVPVVGVPNIVRTITHLARCGIKEIAINLFHFGDAIEAALKNGAEFGVDIVYSREKELLGTGGGIKKAISLLGNETFIVVNGDIVFAPDIEKAVKSHREKGAIATLVVRPDPQAEALGAVSLDIHGRVRRLLIAGDISSDLRTYMFTGVHVLEPEIGEHLPSEGCIVRKTYIPLLEKGMALGGCEDNGCWCDLGTLRQFLDANCALVKGSIRLSGFEPPKNGIFIGRDAVLGAGCQLKPGAIIGDNAWIAPKITVENAVVFQGARVEQDIFDAVVTSDGKVLNALSRS
jgi:NDP-sugar pyrophosphorylase family protein